jgi:hypothetical protein
MLANTTATSARGERWFWAAWGAAFLGFPIGGAAAALLVGPVDAVGKAALGGAVAGAAVAAAQWLVLRRRIPLSGLWIPVSAGAMALGLAVGHLVLGDATTMLPLLLRGLIIGAAIGVAQAFLLRPLLPTPTLWAVVVTVGWAIAWAVSANIGLDLTLKWAVFGSSGALAFQLITGVTLAYLLRRNGRVLAPAPAMASTA